MIFCKELNKEFTTKHEMLKSIYKNRDKIISIKKAHIHTHKRIALRFYDVDSKKAYCIKGMQEIGGLYKDFIYPVISNTNYADSHKDVHLENSMNRTVKNQQGKVHYVINHKLEIGSIIAYPQDVEMLLKELTWKNLGKDYEGKTQALLFKTNIQDYSPESAVLAIKNKLPVENSIRMQYYKLELGIKDRNSEWKEANESWDKHIEKVVNREDVDEDGYLWFVTELKIVDEGSMVVKGSNDATPIKYTDELADSTSSKSESSNDTPNEQLKFYQNLN